MPGVRTDFVARIAAMERVIPSDVVQNRAFTEAAHNESARLVRNGLMVVGVAALEDFVKGRTQEVLDFLSRSGLPFLELPERLREAATVGAVKSTSGHLMRVWNSLGEDVISNIQSVALDVASTTAPAFTISKYSFGFDSSNLTSRAVKDTAKAFGLADPWAQIGRVASRVGLTALSHEEAFTQAMRSRNAAAHQAAAQTEPTDLLAFVRHAKGIAIGFDAVISRAARLLAEDAATFLASRGSVDEDVIIRFLDEGGDGYWREKPEGKSTYRRSRDRSPLDRESLARARRSNELWVLRGVSTVPLDWCATEVP